MLPAAAFMLVEEIHAQAACPAWRSWQKPASSAWLLHRRRSRRHSLGTPPLCTTFARPLISFSNVWRAIFPPIWSTESGGTQINVGCFALPRYLVCTAFLLSAKAAHARLQPPLNFWWFESSRILCTSQIMYFKDTPDCAGWAKKGKADGSD